MKSRQRGKGSALPEIEDALKDRRSPGRKVERQTGPQEPEAPNAVAEPDEQAPEEPAKPRVSAVLVSHNRATLLRRCLESLEASQERETLEILVVDNGSTDGSAQLEEFFPNTRFIRLPRNFGLTKALNIGIRSAQGEYILLLHEDTEVPSEAVRMLAAALEARADATAACPVLSEENAGTESPAEPEPVDFAPGAALMVRAFFLRAMRQIDERFGQFGADHDICLQIRRAGRKILRLPHLRVRHHGREHDTPLRDADFEIGQAVLIAKYRGMAPSLMARTGAALRALARLHLRELSYLLSGQKIDGSQG